jgi:hypothetical protein
MTIRITEVRRRRTSAAAWQVGFAWASLRDPGLPPGCAAGEGLTAGGIRVAPRVGLSGSSLLPYSPAPLLPCFPALDTDAVRTPEKQREQAQSRTSLGIVTKTFFPVDRTGLSDSWYTHFTAERCCSHSPRSFAPLAAPFLLMRSQNPPAGWTKALSLSCERLASHSVATVTRLASCPKGAVPARSLLLFFEDLNGREAKHSVFSTTGDEV